MGLPPGQSTPGDSALGESALEESALGDSTPRQSARAATGDVRVDEAVARLADLDALPVGEHPAVFEYVHERLTEALGDLDVRHAARPGRPGG